MARARLPTPCINHSAEGRDTSEADVSHLATASAAAAGRWNEAEKQAFEFKTSKYK